MTLLNRSQAIGRQAQGRLAYTPCARWSCRAEVAIIGAGFAGLSAARRLAEVHGLDVWRSKRARQDGERRAAMAAFVCRDQRSALGQACCTNSAGGNCQIYRMQREAVDHVRDLVSDPAMGAEPSGAGEWTLAHTPSRIAELQDERDFMRSVFGERLDYVPREELAARGYHPQFHGGLHDRFSFALHPLNYVRELARQAIEAGEPSIHIQPLSPTGSKRGLMSSLQR